MVRATRAAGYGGAREALQQRERPHPPGQSPPHRTRESTQLRALPRRPRRADPRLAPRYEQERPPAGAIRRWTGSRVGLALLLARRACSLGTWALVQRSEASERADGARARLARPRVRRERRSCAPHLDVRAPACGLEAYRDSPSPRATKRSRSPALAGVHGARVRRRSCSGHKRRVGRRVQPGRAHARIERRRSDRAPLGHPVRVRPRSARPCAGHTGPRRRVAFSPPGHGRRLRRRPTLVLWDAAHTPQLGTPLRGHGPVDASRSAPTGNTRRRRKQTRRALGRRHDKQLGPPCARPGARSTGVSPSPGRAHARRGRLRQTSASGTTRTIAVGSALDAVSERRLASPSARTGTRSPPPATRARWCSGARPPTTASSTGTRQRPRGIRLRSRLQPRREHTRRPPASRATWLSSGT